MKESYIRAMDQIHKLCLWVSAVCIVGITLIIPWGVFTRYVLGFGSSWPEPMSILMVIVLSFVSGTLCYRENLHIAVMAVPDAVSPGMRRALGWLVEICMIATNMFMVIWGVELVKITYYQTIAEFPIMSVGLSYLPIPISGALTTLFVIERMWTGAFFAGPSGDSLTITTE